MSRGATHVSRVNHFTGASLSGNNSRVGIAFAADVTISGDAAGIHRVFVSCRACLGIGNLALVLAAVPAAAKGGLFVAVLFAGGDQCATCWRTPSILVKSAVLFLKLFEADNLGY